MAGELTVEGETLVERLCSAHDHLFGAVYEWAGKFREVGVFKSHPHNPRRVSPFAPPDRIEEVLGEAHHKVDQFDWSSATFEAKVDVLADVHTQINFAHPFRDGNGRAGRAVMGSLAAEHDVEVDFEKVSKLR